MKYYFIRSKYRSENEPFLFYFSDSFCPPNLFIYLFFLVSLSLRNSWIEGVVEQKHRSDM